MTTTKQATRKVERNARLRWVPIPQMKVSPLAQRHLNQARVDAILTNLDLEQIGNPTVNERDGAFYVIDGQHRIEALRAYGFGEDSMQCWTYTGLNEAEEAEMYLKLNDVLPGTVFDKFRIGVVAGRPVETDIARIVGEQGMKVSLDKSDGSVRAVGTLRRVYDRSGPDVLARSLQIIRDAYGSAGLEAAVIDGIGLLCDRYNGQLDDVRTVQGLGTAHGGVNGLLNKAEVLRKSTGHPKAHCVAAAAVEIVNRKPGKKLPSWWKAARA